MGGGLNQTPGIQYRGPKPFGRSKDAVGDRLSGEERDSGERTMGVDHRLRKLSLLTPNPPPPARNGTPVKGRWGSIIG
jgi:hypothetical protein